MMRTTGRRSVSKVLGVTALTAVMGLAGAAGVCAAADGRRPLVGVSFASGIFRAEQDSFRSLYGGAQVPFQGRVDLFLGKRVSLFAGFRYLHKKGTTQIAGTAISEDHHPLEFTMSSARAGMDFLLPRRSLTFSLGIGASYNWISERWLDLPLKTELKKPGFFVHVGAGLDLSRLWEAFVRLEYSSVPTRRQSYLEPRVNLGGEELVLGLTLRL